MYRLRSFAILILLAACAAQPEERAALAPRWHPLRWVIRDRTVPTGWARTATPCVYTRDPGDLLDGSVDSDALLAHEQVHAQRQEQLGLASFLANYNRDAGFRTAEEKLAYRAQIRWHAAHRSILDPHVVAEALVSYQPPLTVDYPTALTWAAQEVTEALHAQ